jgi:heme-degrading monooxygenase HmoA
MTCYTYLWEFLVDPEDETQFVEHYGPDGAWVRLFEQAEGFIETRLLKDKDRPGRYVTMDRWTCLSAYEAFRERFAVAYAALDQHCEGLTQSEVSMGAFHDL